MDAGACQEGAGGGLGSDPGKLEESTNPVKNWRQTAKATNSLLSSIWQLTRIIYYPMSATCDLAICHLDLAIANWPML